MSQLPSADALKADPNLVPLLDLVFQLIMFFMICVNFVSAQVDQDVQLPVAQSARATEKSEADLLFLNMDSKGALLVPGQARALRTPAEARAFLTTQYASAESNAGQSGQKGRLTSPTIIIRADKNANYLQVYDLLQICKSVGYQKLQLRTLTKPQG